MGNLKSKALKSGDREHQLTDKEFNYLKILNLALQYNTLKDKLISGYLYYVSTNRLGYPDGENLMFEIDLDQEVGLLKVTTDPKISTIAQQG